MYIRLFRDAGAAGGSSGGNLGLSLSDIEKKIKDKAAGGQQYSTDPDRQQQQQQNDGGQQQQQNQNQNQDDNNQQQQNDGGIKSGDGKDKKPDLKDQQQKQDQQQQQDDNSQQQQQNQDNNQDDNTGGDDNQDDDPMAFWTSVNKLTGYDVKVEYPEGVVLRENAVRDHAVDQWEQQLREKYPRAWAYMMHHMDGGSDAEFLNTERGIALPERSVVETDVEVATRYFREDLRAKGIDDEIIDQQIAKAVKDNKITEKGLAVYDRVKKEQETERNQIEERNRQNNARIDGIMKTAITKVEKAIPELSFVVPDNRKADFVKFADEHMQIDPKSGEIFMVTKFGDTNAKAVLEALAFQFLGADLGKIVQKKVSTQAAQRLRQSADRTKVKQPTDQGQQQQQTDFVPLSQMGGPSRKK